jgi:hypothetical protein
MTIRILGVQTDFDPYDKKIPVDKLINVIKEHFKDVEYVSNTADDPDNFHTDCSLKPYIEPSPTLEKVWVHSKQQFVNMDVSKFEDNELYIYKDECYHGKKYVTTDEYNSLTHNIKDNQ